MVPEVALFFIGALTLLVVSVIGFFSGNLVLAALAFMLCGISAHIAFHLNDQQRTPERLVAMVDNIRMAFKSYEDVDLQAVTQRHLGHEALFRNDRLIVVGSPNYFGIGLRSPYESACIRWVNLLADRAIRVVIRDEQVIFTQDGTTPASFLLDAGGTVIKGDEHDAVNVNAINKACQGDKPMMGFIFR